MATLGLASLVSCGSGSVGKTVYIIGLGTSQVAQLQVSSSGVLTATPNVASVGANPTFILIEPRKRFAYVADSSNGVSQGAVSQLSVATNTGVLSPITLTNAVSVGQPVLPQPVGTNPVALAVDAGGNFLFVANKGSNSISVFSIVSDGTLSEVKGSPFPTAKGPVGLALHGNNLFVANQGTAQVSAYTFDSSSGVLSQVSGSPYAAGTSPTAIAIDPGGKFVYVADGGQNAILTFSVSSGGLSASSGSTAAGTLPVSLNVSPSGGLLFVANQGSNNVSVFTIDSGSGALTAASGSPYSNGTGPTYVHTDGSGGFLFVANGGSNDVSVFTIGSNGALTAAKGSPFANSGVGQPSGITTLD